MLAAALGLVAGCGIQRDDTAAPPMTRPAGRTTCDEAHLGTLPDGFGALDRRLVPYSGTVSGVEATYGAEDGRSVLVISGGYLDDALEAYDDLVPAGDLAHAGVEMSLLSGEFRGRSVRVALWRVSSDVVPCSARAIVALGLTAAEFDALAMTTR